MKALKVIEKKRLVWVLPDEPLSGVMEKMVKERVGGVLVCDEKLSQISGIVTERDLLKWIKKNQKGLLSQPVKKHMSRKVISARRGDSLAKVYRLMTKNEIRHIPLVGKNKIEGMVSMRDVTRASWDEAKRLNKELKDRVTVLESLLDRESVDEGLEDLCRRVRAACGARSVSLEAQEPKKKAAGIYYFALHKKERFTGFLVIEQPRREIEEWRSQVKRWLPVAQLGMALKNVELQSHLLEKKVDDLLREIK